MILFYFVFLFFIFLKSKSIVVFLISLQVISLLGIMFIGKDYPIVTFFDFFNLMLTLVILTLIIVPWRKFSNIKTITYTNKMKLRKITRFLIIISILPFIIFTVTSIFVFSYVDDINDFKYAEGVSTDFYYSLPFNVKLIIISTYIYGFSYFLIPLHFYYLAKKNYRLSLWCFIFSLNIILYGVTYFSRAVFAHYTFIYISFLIILYGTLENRIKKSIKKIMFILIGLVVLYFVNISVKRFTTDDVYAENIPSNSYIQEPVVYSYFDYLSQWHYNSMYVLSNYDNSNFGGQISLQPVLSLLGQYNIIDYKSSDYVDLRRRLWPLHYYTFNGFVAYVIYDFGYFLAVIFSLIYYYIIIKLRPKNNQISLLNLFLIVLVIQLPLFAIFYSTLGGILIPLLLSIPIFVYMKIPRKRFKISNY